MKQHYTVNIAGYALGILSDDSEEYILNLAQKIDEDVRNVVSHSRNATMLEAALLVAMDSLDSKAKACGEFKHQQAQMESQLKEIALLKAQVEQLKAELAVKEFAPKEEAPAGEQLAFDLATGAVAEEAQHADAEKESGTLYGSYPAN